MAVKESNIRFCDPEIFQKGRGACTIDGDTENIERWVRSVATAADAKVDWHFSGGRANVLHLGDEESYQRVLNTIREMQEELVGRILSIGGPALYRNGVQDPDAVGPVVDVVDGQVVLHDPEALAVIRGVGKHNCRTTLKLNADRVEHFKGRIAEKGYGADQVVIVLVNVDDANGASLAGVLMPGQNWQEIRDRGETPFARGLAVREGIQEALDIFDAQAAAKLQAMTDIAVVVVDHGVAEVFTA